ncbi:hypothetical protein [Novosphingobium sp. THN1]|nr:hypothetical protein [Novosphingobium sp. THN1]
MPEVPIPNFASFTFRTSLFNYVVPGGRTIASVLPQAHQTIKHGAIEDCA